MASSLAAPKATVIISVYKDVEALRCILWGLEQQTEKDFEIIVTEDGEFSEMASYLASQTDTQQPVTHLTQEDNGFRKTRAVNRAVATANAPYVIFLDGDCIPRPDFIKVHLEQAERNRICTGRKINLGPGFSRLIRNRHNFARLLNSKLGFLLMAIPLLFDRARNIETGFGGKLMHHFSKHREQHIIGANFACYVEDMLKVNGYNEDLPGIGGEDDDLDWRFTGAGVMTKNTKFLTPVYHLYHESRRYDFETNLSIIRENRSKNKFVCDNGLRQHMKAS